MSAITRPPALSIIVIFHNMRREAARTLYSLTPEYQNLPSHSAYEVLAIDSNSSEPLDEAWVKSFGPQFHYQRVSWSHPSPVHAVNVGVAEARSDNIMCMIDGARLLSPGVLPNSLEVLRQYPNPFVYTLGMHLGPKVQNLSMLEGYDQALEDKLLDSIDWRNNGYLLFGISSVALSSKKGFYSPLSESNCFAMCKSTYQEIGGMNERFISRGGGFVNLDFFKKATLTPHITPVMLLGEASFHQYHGGVATNVPMDKHPARDFQAEYQQIYGTRFEAEYRQPEYFGAVSPESAHLLMS